MKRLVLLAGLMVCSGAMAQVGHYAPYKVSADFHEVANRKAFMNVIQMSPQAQQMLGRNLFVVTPGDDTQMDAVYADNDYRNLPDLVTADWILHIYHVFYDGLLRSLETTSLSKIATRMSGNLLTASLAQWNAATNPDQKSAALKNVAYAIVAAELFESKVPDGIPAEATDLARNELALINSAQGFADSPLFGGKVDYSQFIVRGHYTRSAVLQRYFKGMTWLSMTFSLTSLDGSPNKSAIDQAVLLSELESQSAIRTDWQRIYDPTALFVGPSNGYTPDSVNSAAASNFEFGNEGSYAMLVGKLSAMGLPKIVSRKDKTGLNPNMPFAFLGKRFIPDSMALQELTGDDRPMPSGLDVMAVLGSTTAASILDANPSFYNPKNWSQYVPTREDLAAQFAAFPSDTWDSNLYWGWLDAIRGYLAPTPAGNPSFMMGKAWQDKKVCAASGSWTELRHDTILYGQQSTAEAGGGGETPPFVPEFVEPVPTTFNRISSLLKKTQSELRKMQILDSDASDHISQFVTQVDFLAKMAEKELAGTPFTNDENTQVRDIEGPLGDCTLEMLKFGVDAQTLTEDDLEMGLVADVHTAGDYALEEAIGNADNVIAIVPINGKLYFARGDVFSYYEFDQPIADRLTDQVWKANVRAGKTPPRPAWTSAFYVPTPSTEKD